MDQEQAPPQVATDTQDLDADSIIQNMNKDIDTIIQNMNDDMQKEMDTVDAVMDKADSIILERTQLWRCPNS